MRTRILSGIVVVSAALALAYLGGFWWAIAVAVVAMVGTAESYSLARIGGMRPDRLIGIPLAALLVLTAIQPEHDLLRLTVAVGVIVASLSQLFRHEEDRSAADWLATLAYPMAVGVLMSYLVLLRGMEAGLAWTLVLLLLIWANDSGAYAGGRSFGRTPFFPSLSPKKTREGALTGGFVAIAVGLALPFVAGLGVPFLEPLADVSPIALGIVGLAVSIVGPAGDLTQSFLKRQVGAKDSGDLIPGHGGALDRTDSLLFAAPVVYYAALLIAGAF